MKYCPECGMELKGKKDVCENCGKKLEQAKESETEVKTPVKETSNNVKKSESNGLAVAGFIISLFSFMCCCGSLSWLSLIFSIAGLTKSKSMNNKGKGLAIAGIVISAISILGLIITSISGYLFAFVNDVSQGINDGIGVSL